MATEHPRAARALLTAAPTPRDPPVTRARRAGGLASLERWAANGAWSRATGSGPQLAEVWLVRLSCTCQTRPARASWRAVLSITCLIWVKQSDEYVDSSLPYPDSRYPPNGISAATAR